MATFLASPRPLERDCFGSGVQFVWCFIVVATIKLVAEPTGSSSIRYLRHFQIALLDYKIDGYILDERYRLIQGQLGSAVQQPTC